MNFRSELSANVQTTEIIHDQNAVQTIETRSVEVLIHVLASTESQSSEMVSFFSDSNLGR